MCRNPPGVPPGTHKKCNVSLRNAWWVTQKTLTHPTLHLGLSKCHSCHSRFGSRLFGSRLFAIIRVRALLSFLLSFFYSSFLTVWQYDGQRRIGEEIQFEAEHAGTIISVQLTIARSSKQTVRISLKHPLEPCGLAFSKKPSGQEFLLMAIRSPNGGVTGIGAGPS